MHPINDGDNTLLITVGQSADEDGVAIGLKISLFNSTIPTDPKLVDDFVVEDNPAQSSSTSAAWDERAFRYIQVGDLGRLIIPVTVYSSAWDDFGNYIGDNFEGFMVFGVDISKTEDMIEQFGRIDHSLKMSTSREPDFDACYCYSYLPERSLVFGGDVMTIRNQKVVSTNLVSQETQWTLDLDEALQCCPSQ